MKKMIFLLPFLIACTPVDPTSLKYKASQRVSLVDDHFYSKCDVVITGYYHFLHKNKNYVYIAVAKCDNLKEVQIEVLETHIKAAK